VLSYLSQSASATIEDVGTARMNDGAANVQISPDFAAVMALWAVVGTIARAERRSVAGCPEHPEIQLKKENNK
jgi:hypothetical protein